MWAPECLRTGASLAHRASPLDEGGAWHLSKRVPVPNYLRCLVPETIPYMVSGIRDLKYWVCGASCATCLSGPSKP